MLQKAEKKYKIELIGLKSINMLILFPPLLIALDRVIYSINNNPKNKHPVIINIFQNILR